MTQYSITKNPDADNVVALAQGDSNATAIEVTKNPGNETINFQKNAETKARIVRSGGSQLFGLRFHAPLENDLLLTVGTGPATFARAAASTILDFDGVSNAVLSGEMRFKRARRVENVYSDYADVGAASTNVDGGGEFTTTGFTTATSNRVVLYSSGATTGQEILESVYVKANEAGNIGKEIKLIQSSGGGGGFGAAFVITLSAEYQRIAPTPHAYDGANGFENFWMYGNSSNNATGVTWKQPQFEVVNDQVIQSPGEHVDPDSEHGAGVNGVQYFTTANGNTVSNNIVDETAAGDALTVGGYLANQLKENLAWPSEDLEHANWTTATAGCTAANLGTIMGVPANKLTTDDETDTEHFVSDDFASIVNNVSVSCFAKAGTVDHLWIRATEGGNTATQFFNLATGAVGSKVDGAGAVDVATGTAVMEVYGDGTDKAYRCSVTFDNAGTATHTIDFGFAAADGTRSYSATASDIIGHLTGMQVTIDHETGSYVPTTTTAVTSVADVLTYPIANVTDIGESFSAVLTFTPSIPAGSILFLLYIYDSGGAGTYEIKIFNTNVIRVTQRSNDGTEIFRQVTSAIPAQENKIGVTYSPNSTERVVVLNGVEQTSPATDDADDAWTPDSFSIGNTTGTGQPDLPIKDVKLYSPLTASQLITLTS